MVCTFNHSTVRYPGNSSSAVDNNGNDIMGTTTATEFGTYGMTETFRHETDSNNTTSDNRYVMTSKTHPNGLES